MSGNVFKVAECVELMNKVNNLSAILDDNSSLIPEGIQLIIYNELKSLYETELLIKVNKYAEKKSRKYNGRQRHSQQQYRILSSQYPDKYAVCPICETGMLKENIKLHYQTTQKCRDIYYTKRGVEMCQECIDPQIKSMITEIYGEPIPPLPQDLIDAGNNAPNYGYH
jgi:carboxypeptidase C (cathepsin A)